MAVEYAKDRQQFGRPIGSYQAVSHRCAQMLLETENSRSAVYGAAWAADADPDALPLAASMAQAYASDAGWRVPDASIQVHGGIGFTWEHDLHFFLKRGKANAAMFGDRRLASRAGRGPRPRRRGRARPRLSRSRRGRPRPHLRRGDRHHGRRSRGRGEARRGGRRRVRLGAGAVPLLCHPGRLPRRPHRDDRDRHRDHLGLHAQPLHPRDQRSRHRRDVGRALPARPRLRRQTAERNLAQRRVRETGAAPARGDRGDASDHASGRPGRADPLRGQLLRHRHQGLDQAAPGAARVGPDLHRRRPGRNVPDGGRRRRRPDRPPDPEPALDRRGRRLLLRGGAEALRPRARGPSTTCRRSAARSTTTRRGRSRWRGGRSPSTRRSGPTCRSGSCTASPTTRSRRARPSAAATSPPSPPRSATRWSTPTAPPAHSTR